MEDLVRILQTYGLQIVFVGVLLDQGGLPLPSFSLVIVAAGVATEAGQPVWPIFALAVLATLIADLAWFAGGRRFGAAMLRMICRVSLSPDSCVGNTSTAPSAPDTFPVTVRVSSWVVPVSIDTGARPHS